MTIQTVKNYIQKGIIAAKTHRIRTGIILIVVIGIIFFLKGSSSDVQFETALASVDDIVQSVSVTGNVLPVGKADLSFQKGGAIADIFVAVGDRVKAGDRLMQLDTSVDFASYESAQATLSDIARGLRPEEFFVEQGKVDAAATVLENAKKDAVNAVHDAYGKVQNALSTYTDTLFTNPGSANPTINIPTDSYSSQMSIQQERIAVTQAFKDWSLDISHESDISVSELMERSQKYIGIIKTFLNHLSSLTGALTSSGSGLSQTTISTYTTTVSSALVAVNQSVDSFISAESTLKNASASFDQAKSSFSLKRAGSSEDAIAAQSAKVRQAAAELAKDTIRSPIDGIVTRIIQHEGEYVTPGVPQVSVQSEGVYKIEANVPEADIAKIALGNYSSTTLDAYGSNTYFGATVVSVDPAETIIEGVPTYKVTLHFTAPDERIRSGMTANLEIRTAQRNGVIAIPYRALVDDNGSKSVRLFDRKGASYTTVPVVTGLRGSNGLIEVISGIKAGDKVVTYIK